MIGAAARQLSALYARLFERRGYGRPCCYLAVIGSGASTSVLASGSPVRLSGVHRRHHRSPTSAIRPAGQDPEALLSPGLNAVLLRLRRKASSFWIMLLLVWPDPEHFEPLTLNQRVPGSSPGAPTKSPSAAMTSAQAFVRVTCCLSVSALCRL